MIHVKIIDDEFEEEIRKLLICAVIEVHNVQEACNEIKEIHSLFTSVDSNKINT
jgi:hypothetical protein